MVVLRGRPALEWIVAGSGLLIGMTLLIAGWEYGLSSRSGVGPGTFPATAGFFLALAGAMWLSTLLRHAPAPAVTESVLEAELGPELAHRILDVERANAGQIELDENPLTAHPHLDDDEPAPDPETPAQRRSGAIRVITVVAAIAVAAFLLPYLGFVFVMTLQLLVVLMVAGRQPWLRSLLVAVAAAVATHYIFGELLGVSLPVSLVPGLAHWGI